MTWLVAIDPSKPGNHTGVAWFASLTLYRVELWVDPLAPLSISQQIPPEIRVRLVIELPQVYPGNRSEDPNDLIQVARCVGQWEQAFGVVAETYHPRAWKGTVPKEIHNARTLAKLTPQETTLIPKLPKSKLHNVIDAIGLGLWALKR